ncbi:hypothetical transcript [Echinococcus multilocularis]|uniref:Hypothetical transcript n=1 Tax=Echinococcus multilocularis TaxID=6211 RepID=A0A0S4MLR6_ECHMU|nr:hypothetical transcript [Echinococcus multilocularis]
MVWSTAKRSEQTIVASGSEEEQKCLDPDSNREPSACKALTSPPTQSPARLSSTRLVLQACATAVGEERTIAQSVLSVCSAADEQVNTQIGDDVCIRGGAGYVKTSVEVGERATSARLLPTAWSTAAEVEREEPRTAHHTRELEMPGIEPGASRMQSERSTTELHPPRLHKFPFHFSPHHA